MTHASTLLSNIKVRTGTQSSRNLEARADTEEMEGCYLLIWSTWLAQPAFLQIPGPPAQQWPTHKGLDPPPLDH